VSTVQRHVLGEDKVEVLWRRAFDVDTFVSLEQYVVRSSF
jgi:hypothetical protein